MFDSPAPYTLLRALLVALATSAMTMAIVRRAQCPRRRYRHAWLLAAGSCLSLGTLTMHALGGASMPREDLYAALMAALLGIALNAASLRMLDSRQQPSAGELLAGAGIAIGMLCIHYAALGALRLSAPLQLQGHWSALSLAMALGLCCLAMITARRLPVGRGQLLCTLLLSTAIVLTAYSTQHSLAALPWPAQDSGQGSISLLLASCLLALLVAAVSIAANARLRRRSNRLHLQLGRASEQVSQLHRHDRLTGLPNRTLLREQLESYLRPAHGERPGLALYLIDLIGFNQINALHGHATGDGVLKRVASRLRSTQPSPLMLARLGSDEFVLVQPASSPEQATDMAEQLRTQLAQPIHIHGRVLQISTHIGIALSPADGDTAQRLMSNADAALCHARRQQVPGYSFHQHARQTDAADSQHLLGDLHHAQALGQLRLHYQPKFPSCGYPVVGVEALLRWQHPVHGLIAPDNFIPLAERCGLILPIGNWVLDQACHQLQQWRQAGYLDWTMSVNLSPLQFSDNDLVAVVRDVLARHAIPPSQLILEVTETSALGDMQASLGILNQISALGVRISIDDFGTGYSTLLYLKQLPATELKIDRAFVQNLQPGSDDANIIAAIIELGRTLQMRTVAEGVETLEQQQQLQAMGCDLVQGFHLARPLPVDDFEQRYCTGSETA